MKRAMIAVVSCLVLSSPAFAGRVAVRHAGVAHRPVVRPAPVRRVVPRATPPVVAVPVVAPVVPVRKLAPPPRTDVVTPIRTIVVPAPSISSLPMLPFYVPPPPQVIERDGHTVLITHPAPGVTLEKVID